jgi:predicted phosphodiesterase
LCSKELLLEYEKHPRFNEPVKNTVGVFSDPHIPFDHPNYPYFVADTFKKYNVSQKICCGDIFDFHAASRHQTEPVAKSAEDELEEAKKRIKVYKNLFSKLDIVLGNHDLIILRQVATLGLSKHFLKSLHEVFKLPKSWVIHEDELIIDNVLYKHGINCLGKNGALNTAIQERMSVVIGHSHSFGGVQYSANKRNIIFGLNVGCGIDVSAYAFAYGKHSKYRPTLGCGIVFDEGNAIFVPMSATYFRN